jgi:hypothetical protein
VKLSARHLLKIDRWFHPLNRVFRGRNLSSIRKAQTGRVAVIKLMGLGSIIRLVSLCREKQVDFSRIVLITFESNREACHLLGVDHCLFIRTNSLFHFCQDCLTVLLTVRRSKPDWIIDFERCSNAVSLFRQCLAFAGDSSTASFDDLDPVQTARHTILNIKHYSFHEMLLTGIDRMARAELRVVSEVHRLKDSSKIIVNINCSEYLLARRYPRHLFREVIESLSRRGDYVFYLTGAASEHGYVEKLASELMLSGVRVQNVSGEWTLTQMQHALLTSALFISGDSGPLHLAIHLGVPTLAIWGPTRPRHFGYTDSGVLANVMQDLPCAPCFAHPRSKPAVFCKGQISCLRDLSPGTIIHSAESLLKHSSAIPALTPTASW